MAKITRTVTLNGVKHWIRANTEQDYAEKLLKLAGSQNTAQQNSKHLFADYAMTWFVTYSKPNIETVTATTYKRQLTCHLLPAFDGLMVEDLTTDDVQQLFNGMTSSKATKDKAKTVLNQILDAAVEDGLIVKSPLRSKRIKITGRASKATAPYSVEQMRFLVQHIGDIKNPQDRAYLAIQALHPLRLEEVLGLQVADIDPDNMAIHICRAVTHPTRNQPEIKDTKTQSSTRTIGLSALAVPYRPQAKAGNHSRHSHRGTQEKARGQNGNIPEHPDPAIAPPFCSGGDQLRNGVIGRHAQIHHHVERRGNQEPNHAQSEHHHSNRHGEALRRNQRAHELHAQIGDVAYPHHIANGPDTHSGDIVPENRNEHQQVEEQLTGPKGYAGVGGYPQGEGGAGIGAKPHRLEHRHTGADYHQAERQGRQPAPHAGTNQASGEVP